MIGLYAFNDDITQAWPIQNWTTKWFSVAFHDPEVRDAFLLSVKAATLATLIALVLGTCLSFVIARYRFFGRETISFLVVLPIALPGIVTGLALNATIDTVLRADRDRLRPRHDRDRARDVLHRGRLQQRDRAAAADVAVVRGGLVRPRRRLDPDVPAT